ncbi:MAG: cobalamin biosynthesis protein CbiG [Firmicutes bacterium]|nr:cobalamin biosynthesis protein CbiG [Bacillota bacterium]
MKLAIISVTKNGAVLADKLAKNMGMPVDVYARMGREAGATVLRYDSLSRLIADIYLRYDGLVFIMAAGIVVRVLAPHVRDKRFDPAVVVLDEAGEHVISLLSGHIGGANELAKMIAEIIDARPVITTATDVMNKPAADLLAVRMGLEIEPFDKMKAINAAIANGERVAFAIDRDLVKRDHYVRLAGELGVERVVDLEELADSDSYDAAVLITDKEYSLEKPHVFLRPATLAVGIGCRLETDSEQIDSALEHACKRIGRSKRSIAIIGTARAKKDEVGLLAVVQQLGVPLEIFSNEDLEACIENYQLDTSMFVKAQIGVGNVCEPAALLGGQTDKLLLPKTIYGKTTVAIAEVKFR